MHRPGTTAVWEAPAGFEAQAAAGAAASMTGPAASPGFIPSLPGLAGSAPPTPVTMSGMPASQRLPCSDDPELFFAESPADVEYAKAMCRACPGRIACLSGAMERNEPWGVWGGELFLRGEIVPRKRPRGRPRKTEVAA
jgi:WhiB family transcriptional regulator, redox-sensing transcriptional regulator